MDHSKIYRSFFLLSRQWRVERLHGPFSARILLHYHMVTATRGVSKVDSNDLAYRYVDWLPSVHLSSQYLSIGPWSKMTPEVDFALTFQSA